MDKSLARDLVPPNGERILYTGYRQPHLCECCRSRGFDPRNGQSKRLGEPLSNYLAYT
jgi:hypothetical protein